MRVVVLMCCSIVDLDRDGETWNRVDDSHGAEKDPGAFPLPTSR
jgi:hypothetical protein